MELRRHWNPKTILIGIYAAFILLYMIVGLQSADATKYNITGQLNIPSIGLSSDVATLELNDHRLDTPNSIIGSYSESKNTTLLIGHSTTVFSRLKDITMGDVLLYNNQEYRVISVETMAKSDIKMRSLLAESRRETLILMTCAGTLLDGGDATHRLIVTAVAK